MVGNGLSEIKQKREENVGECRRVPEEVGVKWMFKWHMTTASTTTIAPSDDKGLETRLKPLVKFFLFSFF